MFLFPVDDPLSCELSKISTKPVVTRVCLGDISRDGYGVVDRFTDSALEGGGLSRAPFKIQVNITRQILA